MSATSNRFDESMPSMSEKGEGSRRPKVLFINRSYWPDGEATGQLLTELTEDLADRFRVTVIAGRPNVNTANAAISLWRAEQRAGVRILRVPHTRWPKRFLPFRAVNLATFFLAACGRALFVRRQDVVILETDPFLLALAGPLLRRRHHGRLVIYLQDIHPGLGVAIGRLKSSWLTRFLEMALRWAYGAADRLLVLSGDMRQTLINDGHRPEHCLTIPNWVDTSQIAPGRGRNAFRASGAIAEARFVVMYSGNLGATQRLENLLEAAEALHHEERFLFVLIGSGAAEGELRGFVRRRGLENVLFFPYQPKEMLAESLAAADLHVVSVQRHALRYLMPSKIYGIFAAGRPVLAAIEKESSLARLIESEGVGRLVPPGDSVGLAAAIREAAASGARLREQGERARRLAEQRYDRSVVTSQFAKLLEDLTSGPREGRLDSVTSTAS